jgi:hypothetical protein
MTKKSDLTITLAEAKAFIDSLSDDWYIEGGEEVFTDEFYDGEFEPGQEIVIPKDSIAICYQGYDNNEPDSKGFVSEFIKWKQEQTTEFVTFEIPKGMKEEVTDLVKKFVDDNNR